MSLLPTDHLDILVQQDAVQWCRSGWRTRTVDHGALPYESSAERWAGPLAAMRELLASVKGRPSIKVVLSSYFVRYTLLPWQRGLSQAEWTEYARHQFSKIYGKSTAEWEFRLDDSTPECPRVASAINAGLIKGLKALVHDKKLRLTSVQPLLMYAYNYSLPQLKGQRFWFVVAEPGKVSLGLISNGGWRRLQSRLIRDAFSVELLDFLRQEALINDEPEEDAPVYIYAPHLEPSVVGSSGKWKLHWLGTTALKWHPANTHNHQPSAVS